MPQRRRKRDIAELGNAIPPFLVDILTSKFIKLVKPSFSPHQEADYPYTEDTDIYIHVKEADARIDFCRPYNPKCRNPILARLPPPPLRYVKNNFPDTTTHISPNKVLSWICVPSIEQIYAAHVIITGSPSSEPATCLPTSCEEPTANGVNLPASPLPTAPSTSNPEELSHSTTIMPLLKQSSMPLTDESSPAYPCDPCSYWGLAKATRWTVQDYAGEVPRVQADARLDEPAAWSTDENVGHHDLAAAPAKELPAVYPPYDDSTSCAREQLQCISQGNHQIAHNQAWEVPTENVPTALSYNLYPVEHNRYPNPEAAYVHQPQFIPTSLPLELAPHDVRITPALPTTPAGPMLPPTTTVSMLPAIPAFSGSSLPAYNAPPLDLIITNPKSSQNRAFPSSEVFARSEPTDVDVSMETLSGDDSDAMELEMDDFLWQSASTPSTIGQPCVTNMIDISSTPSFVHVPPAPSSMPFANMEIRELESEPMATRVSLLPTVFLPVISADDIAMSEPVMTDVTNTEIVFTPAISQEVAVVQATSTESTGAPSVYVTPSPIIPPSIPALAQTPAIQTTAPHVVAPSSPTRDASRGDTADITQPVCTSEKEKDAVGEGWGKVTANLAKALEGVNHYYLELSEEDLRRELEEGMEKLEDDDQEGSQQKEDQEDDHVNVEDAEDLVEEDEEHDNGHPTVFASNPMIDIQRDEFLEDLSEILGWPPKKDNTEQFADITSLLGTLSATTSEGSGQNSTAGASANDQNMFIGPASFSPPRSSLDLQETQSTTSHDDISTVTRSLDEITDDVDQWLQCQANSEDDNDLPSYETYA